jgi:tRNA U34 5-carboxymethylaminomethyl modifying GTPase MnmE/TrmE
VIGGDGQCGWRDIQRVGDELERAGIDNARATMADADLVLWVIDATESQPQFPLQSLPAIVVANKIDLVTKAAATVETAISAKTGQGIDGLLEIMSRRLALDVPVPGTAVPCSGELVNRLTEIANQLANGEVISAIAALRKTLAPNAT